MASYSYLGPAPPGTDNWLDWQIEMGRWDTTQRAVRLLYGTWDQDLELRARNVLGSMTLSAWGKLDLSSNAFRQIWDALATLYDDTPAPSHPDPAGQDLLSLVADTGYWAGMQRVQRDTLGIREMVMRVDVVKDKLAYRPVFPCSITAYVEADTPTEPYRICESRQIYNDELKRTVYAWEDWNIYEGRASRQIHYDGLIDPYVVPGPYPFYKADGTPVLPYVIYHASKTKHLWDITSQLELMEGTYTTAINYSFFENALLNASFGKPYGIDVEVEGAETVTGKDGRAYRVVATDPGVFTLFRAKERADGSPPTPEINQLPVPVDPSIILGAVRDYERKFSIMAGLPADQVKMDGDPRSGYAVSVSRDAQRQLQRKYEPIFREADLKVIQLSAIALNNAGLGPFPEDGYEIAYAGIALSKEELAAKREHVLALIDAGLMSKKAAYMSLNPGTSEEAAEAALDEIKEEQAEEAPDPLDMMAKVGQVPPGVEPDTNNTPEPVDE